MMNLSSSIKIAYNAAYPLVIEATLGGLSGAAACLIANKVGITILATNPWSGLVVCSLSPITMHLLSRVLKAAGIPNLKTMMDKKVINRMDAIYVMAYAVSSIALTTFAISLLAPNLAVTTATGVLTWLTSIYLAFIIEEPLRKLGLLNKQDITLTLTN